MAQGLHYNSYPGFQGNTDLYGIGIRIGYYTTALSLWISQLWAPTETHFLHPITLTFAVAVLVGVSVYSAVPSAIFAIEPFMMMQIAYYTYFMGLGAPHPPNLLQWEIHYFKSCLTIFVGLCLHGFDTWYWWRGLYQMKPTPGAKTLGIFVYFGQADLFKWICYPMRVYLAFAVLFHTWFLATSLSRRSLQRKMDREVPPSRLKELSERWADELDPPRRATYDEDEPRQRTLLSPPSVSRQPSKSSVKSAPVRTLASNHEFDKEVSSLSKFNRDAEWRRHSVQRSQDGEKYGDGQSWSLSPQLPSPELPAAAGYQLERTGTGRLKQRLLGWHAEPTYGDQATTYYTPTLKALAEATDLLESINKARKCNWTIAILRFHFNLAIAILRVLISLFTNRMRPRIFIAIMTHWRALSYTRQRITPTMWRLAVQHPSYNYLQAEDIALASRIMFTLAPLRRIKKAERFCLAYALFMTCALLVIGTELAIQWNHIQGVQNLKTVGQLIPAAIGVGGLVKVLWAAIFEKRETARMCFGKCIGDKRRLEWADACEVYAKASIAWKKRRDEESGGSKKEMQV